MGYPEPTSDQHMQVVRRNGVLQSALVRTKSRTKGPGYQPAFKRKAATKPLTEEEWKMVQETAKEMSWRLRAGSVTEDGSYQPPGGMENTGGDPDPDFIFRTVSVLYFTGCRIGLLPFLHSRMIRIRGKVPYLKWDEHHPGLPIPSDMRPWLATYLDQPKPLTVEAYQYMLKKLSNRVMEKFGVKVYLSPNRFHHVVHENPQSVVDEHGD